MKEQSSPERKLFHLGKFKLGKNTDPVWHRNRLTRLIYRSFVGFAAFTIVLFLCALIYFLTTLLINDWSEIHALLHSAPLRDSVFELQDFRDEKTGVEYKQVRCVRKSKTIFLGRFGCGGVYVRRSKGMIVLNRSIYDKIEFYEYKKNPEDKDGILLPPEDGTVFWQIEPDGKKIRSNRLPNF